MISKVKEIYNDIRCHLLNKCGWLQRQREKNNFIQYQNWKSCYSCEYAKSRLDGKYNCKSFGITEANALCGEYKLRSKHGVH